MCVFADIWLDTWTWIRKLNILLLKNHDFTIDLCMQLRLQLRVIVFLLFFFLWLFEDFASLLKTHSANIADGYQDLLPFLDLHTVTETYFLPVSSQWGDYIYIFFLCFLHVRSECLQVFITSWQVCVINWGVDGEERSSGPRLKWRQWWFNDESLNNPDSTDEQRQQLTLVVTGFDLRTTNKADKDLTENKKHRWVSIHRA